MADDRLERYFHFDQADLQANRAGQFTEKQKQRLRKEDADARKSSTVFALFLLAVAAIGPFGAVLAWQGFDDMTSRLIFAGGFGVIWTLVWGSMAWGQLHRALFKHDYRIGRAQGHAKVVQASQSVGEGRVSFHHEMQIGGQRFLATTFLGEIVNGTEATVYYVDRSLDDPYNKAGIYSSDSVLSMELLGAAGASRAPSEALRDDAEDAEMMAFIRQGDTRGAIMKYRAMHNCDFEEARKAVDLLTAGGA